MGHKSEERMVQSSKSSKSSKKDKEEDSEDSKKNRRKVSSRSRSGSRSRDRKRQKKDADSPQYERYVRISLAQLKSSLWFLYNRRLRVRVDDIE